MTLFRLFLGYLIASGSLAAAILHLNQSASSYYDFVALVMVIGGTCAVAVITFGTLREVTGTFFQIHRDVQGSYRSLNRECMEFVWARLSGGSLPESRFPGLGGRILRDGRELLGLSLAPERMQLILEERIIQGGQRIRAVANQVRSLSKYPPAFGLAGTILGLVSVMRAISNGASSSQIGLNMGIALVATFYGILLSNLVINPTGELILLLATTEERKGLIALRAVIMAKENTPLIEAQEMLNSLVPDNERLNLAGELMGAAVGDTAAASNGRAAA